MGRVRQIYIAAPWVCKEHAAGAARAFEHAGFDITERWWEHPEVNMADPAADGELTRQAMKDIDGVMGSDVLVVLQLALSEGKAVETGIAIAAGIPVVVVGERSPKNIFHYLSDVTVVPTIPDAIAVVRDHGRAAA